MTFPTHILAGLIIGKLTGDYTAALAGSLVMDVVTFSPITSVEFSLNRGRYFTRVSLQKILREVRRTFSTACKAGF